MAATSRNKSVPKQPTANRAAPDPTTAPDRKIDIILAVYQADRNAHANNFSSATTLLAVGTVYASATVFVYDGFVNTLPVLFVGALPLPLWIIALYHSVTTSAAMARSASIVRAEELLMRNAGVSANDAARLGFTVVDEVFNPTRARWPHRLATVFSYAGVGFMSVGATAYLISQEFAHHRTAAIAFLVTYSLITLLWITSWSAGAVNYVRHRAGG